MTVEVDVVYKVYDEHGHGISVGPRADDPTIVEIAGVDKSYFKDIAFTLTPEMAAGIGEALQKAGEDLLEREKKE